VSAEKPDSPQVAAARIEAARARSKLMGTAHELQERISPKTLTREAWEGAKTKGADLVEDAVDAVKSRPLTTTGVVAAIAMFLAREPLMDLASNVVDGVSSKKKARKAPKAGRKQEKTETIE